MNNHPSNPNFPNNPNPGRNIIEITSRMAEWARLIALYVDPSTNNAFKMEAVLTPEWMTAGGWEYLAEVVDVMMDQMLGPLGIKALPDIEWRVLPFYANSPPDSQLVIPHHR